MAHFHPNIKYVLAKVLRHVSIRFITIIVLMNTKLAIHLDMSFFSILTSEQKISSAASKLDASRARLLRGQ